MSTVLRHILLYMSLDARITFGPKCRFSSAAPLYHVKAFPSFIMLLGKGRDDPDSVWTSVTVRRVEIKRSALRLAEPKRGKAMSSF